MALFSEGSLQCARKLLDTADIVRDAIFRRSLVVIVSGREIGLTWMHD
jgi:hypothetical protein